MKRTFGYILAASIGAVALSGCVTTTGSGVTFSGGAQALAVEKAPDIVRVCTNPGLDVEGEKQALRSIGFRTSKSIFGNSLALLPEGSTGFMGELISNDQVPCAFRGRGIAAEPIFDAFVAEMKRTGWTAVSGTTWSKNGRIYEVTGRTRSYRGTLVQEVSILPK